MGTTSIDERGRIVIPKELREKLGLREGMRLKIVEDKGSIKILPIREQEILKELKGCIKEKGEIDPLKVKEIWQM